MNSSRLLQPVFSPLRAQILASTLLQPGRQWYMLELARHIGVARSSLQRELVALVESEILISRQDGNRVYYRANPQCPILSELQSLLVKTVGYVESIRSALSTIVKKIDVAFIYGSFAQASELVDSDLDLLIIGEIGLMDIAPVLSSARKAIGREINPIVLSSAEAKKRCACDDHFFTSVLKSKKIFLVGDACDLATTLGREQDQTSLD